MMLQLSIHANWIRTVLFADNKNLLLVVRPGQFIAVIPLSSNTFEHELILCCIETIGFEYSMFVIPLKFGTFEAQGKSRVMMIAFFVEFLHANQLFIAIFKILCREKCCKIDCY